MGTEDYSAFGYVHPDTNYGDRSVYATMHGVGTYGTTDGMKDGVTEHVRQWSPQD